MNIFLDTNALYKDPFLSRGNNTILRRLARHEDVKLFVNQTVYSELLRSHQTFLEKQVKAADEALSKLISYLNKERDTLDIDVDTEDLIADLKSHFSRLEEEEQLKIVPYDTDVLQDIVEVDMYEKAPFIKKEQLTNKGGQKVPYTKKEMRDAIIWYSYQRYIEKNDLKDCYFISNNTREFGDENAGKTPDGEPYSFHPEIAENSKLIPYRNANDFLVHNAGEVKSLFLDLYTKILSDDLYGKVYEELKNGLAEELIITYFEEQILSQTQNFLSDKDVEDLHEDYFIGGYISALGGYIRSIEFLDFDIYGDEITVALDITVEMDVEIYLTNPVYDDRHEKYQYQGINTIEVEENVIFILPIDTEKDIDETDFSLSEYIKDVEPNSLDVDFVDWHNSSNPTLFSDEPEYEE